MLEYLPGKASAEKELVISQHMKKAQEKHTGSAQSKAIWLFHYFSNSYSRPAKRNH